MKTVTEAAQALCERWDTDLWKAVDNTAVFIHDLKTALSADMQVKHREDNAMNKELLREAFEAVEWGRIYLPKRAESRRMSDEVLAKLRAAIDAPEQQPADDLTDVEITSLAYDCNALPEVVTDKTLIKFARALLAAQKGKL